KISMLLPLFYALMKNWISADTEPLKKLISEKLQNINTQNRNFTAIKSKAVYYLPSDGIIALCDEIIKRNERLDNVSDFLEIPQSMAHYEYFGEAAETYTKLITRTPDFINKIDEILSFLKEHDSKDTHKKCVEKIVLKLDKISASESIRMEMLNFCFQYIGDPSSDHNWSPWVNSNENDRQNLEGARKVLNNWLAKKFIYLFFDKLSMDSSRRIFWNRYIDHVTNFKIYMDNVAVLSFKRNNQEIEPAILKHKLGILEYGGGTSSFVLVIKNYHFVEFSQTGGACYIYKSENKNKLNLNWDRVSLSQLKNSNNRQMAVRLKDGYCYHRDEGRVFHQGNWQQKFKFWIKEHLGI
ncbi:MAG: EH signature domain-containing protein, partial [Candidatus Cloacimonadota bacterium]|nr:EH signature domain-containing protein [Candidatus Cloacimonadota bacterium]